MSKTLLPAFFLLAMNGFSQEKKWRVSFTPTLVAAAISPHPGLQLGLEYKIRDRLHLLTEFAVPLKKDDPVYATDIRYFRLKPEVRYSTDNETGLNYYTGLQVSFIYRKWEDHNGGSYFEEKAYEDSAITFSSATIKSPSLTSAVQFGTLIGFGEKIVFDFFFGMGARLIHTTYSEVRDPGKDFSIRPNCKVMISPDPAHWVNGKILRFHFNTGIRFLYRF